MIAVIAIHISIEAQAIFETTRFRCCSLEDFSGWHDRAVECSRRDAARHPGSARQFCYDCLPMVREEMTAQGRCVLADRLKVVYKEP